MPIKTKLYKAKIGNKNLKVDIYDLPYGKFNSENPLIIMERVVFDAPSQRRIDLTNVKFDAGIDVPTQNILKTQDPLIERLLGLSRQIGKKTFARRVITLDFDALDYDAPKTQSQKEISTKKADEQNQEAKTEEVKVEEKNVIETPLTEQKSETKESEEPDNLKTSDFVSISDIFKICSANPFFEKFGLSDSELEQEIRKLFKTFDTHFRLDPKTKQKVRCISASYIAELIKKLQASLNKTTSKKTVVKQPETQRSETPKPKSRHLVAQHEVSRYPIAIKKYIPKNLWKDICKACGKNVVLQKFVLDTIASVNTNLHETPSSTHLQIIDPETFKRTRSSYLKREEVNCIVQSISGYLVKDNKRVLWAYLPQEKVLVCTGIYTEHTKTKRGNSYSKTRDFASVGLDANGETITLQRIINEGYLDVDDLLKQYTDTPAKTSDEEVVVDVKPVQIPEAHEHVEEKKADEVVILENENVTNQQTTPAEKAEQIINIEKPHNLVDIRAVEIQIESIIDLITKSINQDLIGITHEDDTAKQLEQLDLAREALIQKAKIQALLPELNKTNEILQKLQTIVNSKQK